MLRLGRALAMPRTSRLLSLYGSIPQSTSPDPLGKNPGAASHEPNGKPRMNVSIARLQQKRNTGVPITMMTAYDYPSAVHVDLADIDILLVGDSVAMVELGYPTTQPATLDMMIHHCSAVTRATRRPLVVCDLPFGSYETSDEAAIGAAMRCVKEGGAAAVKLEGGARRASAVRAIVDAGIAVMGHVGLTPQHVSALGGFRSQGHTAASASKIVEDAEAIAAAGAFSIVVECVPAVVGAAVTRAVEVPTIGIGAGPHTNGQVLVFHDMVGMISSPHHEAVAVRFCKRYANVGAEIRRALSEFRDDVKGGRFPAPEQCPYRLPDGQVPTSRPSLWAAALAQHKAWEKSHNVAPPPAPAAAPPPAPEAK